MTAIDEKVTTIELRVETGDQIVWSMGSNGAAGGLRRTETMLLDERRKETIDLLTGLLSSSTDVECVNTDLEQSYRAGRSLYEDLTDVVGHELFDLLFVGEIRRAVIDALEHLRDADLHRLRIILCFTGPRRDWLSALPWEYARTPPCGDKNGEYLSTNAELILSRRLDLTFRPLGTEYRPVKMLLVCSSPPRLGDENLEHIDAYVVPELLNDLAEAGVIDLVTLIEPDPPREEEPLERVVVTRKAFRDAIVKQQPAIVHFIGHGHCQAGAGALALASGDGTVNWITDAQFQRDISKSRHLKLVVLQACKSALPDPYVSFSGVARAIAGSGVPAVVGMQYRITSQAANEFATTFYDCLFDQGLPISYAVQAGRDAIALLEGDDCLGFGLPVLYLSEDGVLGQSAERRGHGPRTRAVNRRDALPTTLNCPRCAEELSGPEQKVCQECGLRLVCPEPECGKPYENPVRDRFCRHCQARVRQPPYGPDALDLEPAVPESSAARGAISLMQARLGGDAA